MPCEKIVYHADALSWLKENGPLVGSSIVTSLPDISEFPKISLEQWQEWFFSTAELVLSSYADDGVAIFYQTDIKVADVWVDKGFLVQKAAEKLGQRLVAHKIVCRVPPGIATSGGPTYSHLLCFSKGKEFDSNQYFPDVLPEAGKVSWTRGMGENVCRLACQMVLAFSNSRTIVDPFCGHGAILEMANQMGLHAIGVDHSLKCVKIAGGGAASDQPLVL